MCLGQERSPFLALFAPNPNLPVSCASGISGGQPPKLDTTPAVAQEEVHYQPLLVVLRRCVKRSCLLQGERDNRLLGDLRARYSV